MTESLPSVEHDGTHEVEHDSTPDVRRFDEHPGAHTVSHDGRKDRAVELVRHWLAEAAKVPANASAERLAGVLRDPNGLDFTVGFVDGVIRPEDLGVAARNLARLAPTVPGFLPFPLKIAVRLGGLIAPLLPTIVVPIARRVLRGMVGHLIVDATPNRLGRSISTVSPSSTTRGHEVTGLR